MIVIDFVVVLLKTLIHFHIMVHRLLPTVSKKWIFNDISDKKLQSLFHWLD